MKNNINILYIHPYAGSQVSPKEWRPYYITKNLTKLTSGEVSVITSGFHHLQKETIEQNSEIFTKEVDSVKFFWLKNHKYYGNGVKRITNMFKFGLKILMVDPVETLGLDKPDLIIASSAHPFHFIGALRWKRKYGCKLFFEIRDLWPLSLNLIVGLHRFNPFSLLLDFFQYIGLRYSDKTIGLAINMDKYLVTKGLSSDKFLYVCNGVDFDQPRSKKSILDEQLHAIRTKYRRVIIYTGSHGTPNCLDPLIKGFNLIEDDSIALILIGKGSEKVNLVSLSTNDNCYFFPPVPKDEIQQVLSYSDICVISWANLSIYELGVSANKVFDYMFAKKPILQAISSANNQVEQGECGLNVNPEDPKAMAIGLLEICSLSDEALKDMGQKGFDYVKHDFDYELLSSKILDAYKELL